MNSVKYSPYFGYALIVGDAFIVIVGTSCLRSTVETVWTGPLAQWPSPRTLTGPRIVN